MPLRHYYFHDYIFDIAFLHYAIIIIFDIFSDIADYFIISLSFRSIFFHCRFFDFLLILR